MKINNEEIQLGSSHFGFELGGMPSRDQENNEWTCVVQMMTCVKYGDRYI